MEKHKQEVYDVESAFARFAAEKGVKEAFVYFADEDAVLNREGKIVKGKEQIANYFDNSSFQKIDLQWKPDLVEVSKDGTLAYTYGGFTLEAVDNEGNPVSHNGIFHTVWKRQSDGSWKYVYD
jgi:ketosteroid isomerase-like protein